MARLSQRIVWYPKGEMMMADPEITVEILKDIRDNIRGVRTELREEIRAVRTDLTDGIREVTAEVRATNHRLDVVESTLLDLAEQQRFVVRYTKTISERDTPLEARLESLEIRVEKLESD